VNHGCLFSNAPAKIEDKGKKERGKKERGKEKGKGKGKGGELP